MATLAQLQARLESLRKARDTGALSVHHGETSTTFRSLAEMNSIIADLEAQITVASGTGKRVRAVRFSTNDGW